MSNAQFSEALSDDPFIKDLHRRAVRVLNDPSLDRKQRVELIRQLQQRLLAHQAGEANKSKKVASRGQSKGHPTDLSEKCVHFCIAHFFNFRQWKVSRCRGQQKVACHDAPQQVKEVSIRTC